MDDASMNMKHVWTRWDGRGNGWIQNGKNPHKARQYSLMYNGKKEMRGELFKAGNK